MSKKRCKDPDYRVYPMNSCCDFPTLIILILIILQFGQKSKDKKDEIECDCDYDDCNCNCECEEKSKKKCSVIDDGLLFIIALFFLSCCSCRQPYAYYY